MGKYISYFFILALLLCRSSVNAQDDTLRVDDFHFDPSYFIKAKTTSVVDGTNTPCGLVVLRIAIPDARIEGSYVAKVEKYDNEYYIWMANDASYIIIKTSEYLPLEYYFPEPIKSKSSYVMTVRKPDGAPEQYEKTEFRLYVPFAFPIGNFSKGADNWIDGGNAWSNYPFDLTYFFENNKSLSKAARNLGFGIGAKTIIPIKKSSMSIMVQAEYLLTLPNNGNLGAGQTMPAEVFYYQYNPTSGLNNIKVLTTEMNVTFPRLNTMDLMLGINKKFRNIIGSSHLEVEGAVGAAWHWSSDFKGQSITSGEYNFVANYDIFSKIPSLAFEVGVAMTLSSHLSLGLNYVYLGGFDVKGHASWNSTIIPTNDANINNVDFNFGHVTVHYLGLVLSYSVQHK